MCYKMKCQKCKKWTWAGCGNHIKSALKGIPDKDLCKCSKLGTTSQKNFQSSVTSYRNY